MEQKMRERLPVYPDPQSAHVGEIRLGQFSRMVILLEEHLLRWTSQGSPDLDPTLQGPQLTILKSPRILPLQMLE
jgi:hypothetical protein